MYVIFRFFPLSQAPSLSHLLDESLWHLVAHTAQPPREHGLCGKHGSTKEITDTFLEVVPMLTPKCIFIGSLSFLFSPHSNQHFIPIAEAFHPYIALFLVYIFLNFLLKT